ncbi:UNVERIFIED_CONTAM: hypothetical protein FKN15_065306 [Acipenser sinensis]
MATVQKLYKHSIGTEAVESFKQWAKQGFTMRYYTLICMYYGELASETSVVKENKLDSQLDLFNGNLLMLNPWLVIAYPNEGYILEIIGLNLIKIHTG